MCGLRGKKWQINKTSQEGVGQVYSFEAEERKRGQKQIIALEGANTG
jgi:hypothetical protein